MYLGKMSFRHVLHVEVCLDAVQIVVDQNRITYVIEMDDSPPTPMMDLPWLLN